MNDVAIHIMPSLALGLSYLPGVDDRLARDKSKANTTRPLRDDKGRIVGVKENSRGLDRAVVLAQVQRRLTDSDLADIRLVTNNGVRWYVRTYWEWYSQDLPFLPFATLKKTFQDLLDASVLGSMPARDLIKTKNDLGSYNCKAWTINRERLITLMAANPHTQIYLRSPQDR